jgi:hypothetical protein
MPWTARRSKHLSPTSREVRNLCLVRAHAPMKLVYIRVTSLQPRPRFGWSALSANALSPKVQAGVKPVADVESKLRRDITPASDADPLFGRGASLAMRYLASVVMTAFATVIAVGVDSKVTIPNLSLVFVVPVIVAGVSLGLGPSLFGDTWHSGLQFLPYRASLLTCRRRPGKHLGDWTAVCRRTHREQRCLHLAPEGDRGGTLKKAGDCAARLEP